MGMNVNLTPIMGALVNIHALRMEIAQGLKSGASEPWDADAVKRKLRSNRTAKSPAQEQT